VIDRKFKKTKNPICYHSEVPTASNKEIDALDVFSLVLGKFNQAVKEVDRDIQKKPSGAKKIIALHVHKAYRGKKIDSFEYDNEDVKILRSYQNMYYCNREVSLSSDGMVQANYCKNRLCLVCNSIRTAELMNKYEPVFEAWKNDMYLVTLTVVNCTKDNLHSTVNEMFDIFTKVKNKLRKRYKKAEIPKFEGVRKFECTSNRKDDFHPHFHLIVKGKKAAKDLLSEWVKVANKSNILTRNKDNETCNRAGQDIRKADKNSQKELFKYFTKIISSSDDSKNVYLDRLDAIFRVMRGRRVFQNFGFFLKDYKDVSVLKEIEGEEIPDDLLFAFELDNNEEKKVNEIYHKFLHHTDKKGAAVLRLQEDLYVLEIEHELNFKDVLSSNDLELKELAFRAFEESNKERKDVEDLQLILEEINVKEKDYRAKVYGEPVTDEEIPDRIFVFDDVKGMWLYDGYPLIEYSLSPSIRDVVKRFKLPKGYSSKIFELFIKSKENEFIYDSG
jgi:hypothetical protein